MKELRGLVLIAVAILSIWRFGFWWGIGIFGAGFVLFSFVEAVNLASREGAESDEKRRRRRGPPSAQLHAAAAGFLAGVLGFGAAAVIGAGVTGGAAGIFGAAATNTVLDESVGWLLDMDWSGALGSWLLLMLAWLALSVPLSAYIAPGYTVHGVEANVGITLFVIAANGLVWFASPWRSRWRQP